MTSASDDEGFRRERRIGILAIAAAMPVAAGLWLALAYRLPPLAGMETLDARLAFTLKALAVVMLLTLALGTEAVAHERLVSPAFDPLKGYETRRLRVNQRYLQNTLEQGVLFAAALLGLAAEVSDMRAVVASAVVWTLARWAFWLGYHRSAALRGLGAPGMALTLLLLVYVAARFGGEVAGPAGAAAPVLLFLAIEAVLFLGTAKREPRSPPP